jgi:hypothetical protein
MAPYVRPVNVPTYLHIFEFISGPVLPLKACLHKTRNLCHTTQSETLLLCCTTEFCAVRQKLHVSGKQTFNYGLTYLTYEIHSGRERLK